MACDIPVCRGPSLWLRNHIDDESDVELEYNGLIQYYQALPSATDWVLGQDELFLFSYIYICAIILFFYPKSWRKLFFLPTIIMFTIKFSYNFQFRAWKASR